MEKLARDTKAMNAKNKRMPDVFEEPLTFEELCKRILEELPEAMGKFIKEMDLEKTLIEHLRNRSVFPCKDQQDFSVAVTCAETFVEPYQTCYQKGNQKGYQIRTRETSVAALMELQEADITLELRGPKRSNLYSKNHKMAKKEEKRFELKPIPLVEDEQSSIPSNFMSLLKQNEQKKTSLYYFNESDIQQMVHVILQDAVATCNTLLAKEDLQIELQYRLEANIWSEKPDHVVVFDNRSGAPLVSIEVKKPINSEVSLVDFDSVRGQGCDYLYVSKLQGHSNPIHITTTIVQSYVAWLPDNGFVQEYNNASEGDMGEFWRQLFNSVRGEAGTNKLTQSPLRLEQPLLGGAAAGPNHIQVKEIDRTICTSQCFERHQLFQVMVNAILCGLRGSSRSASVPQLYARDRVSQTALELTAKEYKWVELDAVVRGPLPSVRRGRRERLVNIGNNISACLGFSQTTMYAVGVVGFGSTSKAFRVVTSKRYEGVVKVYVKKHDSDGKFELDKKTFDGNAEKSVSTELEVFQNTYPDMPVSKVVVHGHKSLLMPFFNPIRTNHQTYEDRIKEQLNLVKNHRSSLCYKEEDMRWRHIGLYGVHDEIRVFDFNDMTTIKKEEVASRAQSHWETILDRIPLPQEH